MFKQLDVPERLATIVEGEGLTTTAPPWCSTQARWAPQRSAQCGPARLVTLLAARRAVLGLAVGWVVVEVRRRMDQPLWRSASRWRPLHHLRTGSAAHLSGVLATVVAGVYMGCT